MSNQISYGLGPSTKAPTLSGQMSGSIFSLAPLRAVHTGNGDAYSFISRVSARPNTCASISAHNKQTATTQFGTYANSERYARVMLFSRAKWADELQKLRRRRTYYQPRPVDGMIYRYTGLTSLLLLINGTLGYRTCTCLECESDCVQTNGQPVH